MSAGGVTFRAVGHAYRSRRLFHDLHLDVPAGTVLAVLGPSGVGKSTLLRLAAGLHRPTTGAVTAPGRVGYAFAEPRLMPWRTALENVVFALGRRPSDADREHAHSLLTRLGLADSAPAYPAALSTGMRQRVALARALIVRAPLLILDEPVSALDITLRAEVRRTLLELARDAGSTVLWSTHDPHEAAITARQALIIRPGGHRILPLGPTPDGGRDGEAVARAEAEIVAALTGPDAQGAPGPEAPASADTRTPGTTGPRVPSTAHDPATPAATPSGPHHTYSSGAPE
ncbi:ABC transporter ATP-binding protein [Streptomyces sp. NPDC020875]|uniref:ABC transporter ATP-binding protein n=1 Tax=Streptomyces sp. NPDC020875 TaxID=3154898 RepID=UPI0033D438D6